MNNPNHSPILTEISTEGVAIITLNRPEVHNAFDQEMIQALILAITRLESDPLVKLLLLKSSGKSFSSGASLETMRKMATYGGEKNRQDALELANLMYHLSHFPKPTVVAVQGSAFGGGVGLIACCHLALASADATFCFPETKLGLIPAVISPYVVNAIGARHARAYFLTGEKFDATKAYEMGLIYQITPHQELENATQRLLTTLLEKGPKALQEVSMLMRSFQALPITPDTLHTTAQKIADLRASSEGIEGLNAFLEKRKPSWIK